MLFKNQLSIKKMLDNNSCYRLDQNLRRLKPLISAGCPASDGCVLRCGVSYIQEYKTQVTSHLNLSLYTISYRNVTGGSYSAIIVDFYLKLDIYRLKAETAIPCCHYVTVKNKKQPQRARHRLPATPLEIQSLRLTEVSLFLSLGRG